MPRWWRLPGGYQTFRHNDVVKPPPVAGSIVGMDARIVDPSGAEIPQAQLMLHHNVFTNGGPDNTRKDGACPNNAVRERFYRHQRGAPTANAAAWLWIPDHPRGQLEDDLDGDEPPPPAA